MDNLPAQFSKRFYTPRRFLRDVGDLLFGLPSVLRTLLGRRVERALAEKVMLVITQVNGCRYCSYAHSLMALRQGVSEHELSALLGLSLSVAERHEAVALAFAQHYAETDRRPEPDALRAFRAHYGRAVSGDLLNYIRMIYIANLAGNTVDAFLSRLAGKPATGSSVWRELPLFLLFAPFTLPFLSRVEASGRRLS